MTATDGETFLAQVDLVRPDIVLLDVMMPGLSTKQIMARLSRKAHIPPVILVTVVRFSPEEIDDLKKNSPIVGYVAKPFELSEIVECLHPYR
jgi:DNA-binding response OmpR family regulator